MLNKEKISVSCPHCKIEFVREVSACNFENYSTKSKEKTVKELEDINCTFTNIACGLGFLSNTCLERDDIADLGGLLSSVHGSLLDTTNKLELIIAGLEK